MSSYIPVIGLEIHAELLTKSKVFCTCSAEFGGSQNSRCCPVCSQIVLPEGALICSGCVPKLHFIQQPSCKKCGTELISDRAEYCPDCLRRQRSFESGVALIRYDTVAQKSIAAVKYKNRREYLDFYAEAIARRYGYFFKCHKDAGASPSGKTAEPWL